MTTIFLSLCNQISAASSPSSPYDAPKKPLSTLLNEMTYYVAITSKLDNEDESIIYGLQILLLSDVERVRAASLRALRYSVHRTTILDKFLEYRLDYLVCRSLTIDLRNARERLEAYKFIRRLLHLYPLQIPQSFVYALDSIVASSYLILLSRPINSSTVFKSDQMINCCLELLCEIALHNPHILHECHAINTMLKFIVDYQQDELLESVLYALLHAIDRFTINDNSEPTIVDSVNPNGPAWIFVDEGMGERHELIRNMFSQLVAVFPMCEKGNLKTAERRGMTPAAYDNLTLKEPDKMKTLKSCTSALKTILHTWIGFTAFCQSRNSSIRLLVNCLLVQSEPMKMAILDLFYDLLNLDTPAVCDSYEAALKSTYPIWNLTTVEEGYTYVASEGTAKLPRLSSTRPNLLDSHMALMLLSFIDAGFIEAMSEVGSSDNTILSIHATLLLANFIWLCNEHLPEEQSFLLLPLLMDIAIADDDSVKRSFAKEAMLNINVFFEFKQRTRQTYSFQLSQLIYHAQHLNDYFTLAQNIGTEPSRRLSKAPSEDPLAAEKIDNCIRDTNTLQTDIYKIWNWDLILAFLKDFPKLANQVQGDLYERFLDKLFDFFKPEANRGFSSIDLTDSLSNVTCRSLIALSDLLLYPPKSSSNHIRAIASNIVRTLLTSISDALQQSIIAMREGTGRAIITEHDLLSKNSVYYYLFLGRLSKTSLGTQALNDSEIFVRLLEMLKMDDEFATSAIVAVSSFNYYYDGPCRHYLTQTLKSSCAALRLYSTSLLRVILRCNPNAFGHWGLNLLCSQLHDTNQAIILETVSILDEALEDKRIVHIFNKQWHIFATFQNKQPYLTDIYHLAFARLCSIPFQELQYDEKHLLKVREELRYWDTVFNARYVTYIETKLFAAYSGGALLTDDYYERRKTTSVSSGKLRKKRISMHVASHIYRQLCLHNDGFSLLLSESRLEQYAVGLRQHPTNCISLNETRTVKEALWALAHTASTENGYAWFMERDLLPDFLRFAEECQNLSVRGTAFYALSLIAQTPDGSMSLRDFGWETYRLRAHSIPPTVANTDTYQCAERRMSKVGTISLPRRSISLQVSQPPNDSTSKQEMNIPTTADVSVAFRFDHHKDSVVPDVKKRSFTMPSSISVNSNEKNDIRHVVIQEESGPPTPTNPTAIVSFPDGLEPGDGPIFVSVPIRRCSSISKELANISILRDSGGRTGSFSDVDSIRSSSYGTHQYNSQPSTADVESATDSLPLERFRPRSKSAHHSNALRQSKQLQKVPEVIQALCAPTANHGGASEPSPTDELYRSRLLRCNFLLKADAAGYEYARRVQELSHATYAHMTTTTNTSNDFNIDKVTITGKKDELVSPFHTYISKFYKKIYEQHSISNQQVEKFTTNDGKFSFEQRDLDDPDEDRNTIYRGLAVPVDMRQVVEISDGYNLNYETWSDLVRSRANTNADQTRTRSATTASNGSGEFAPVTSPLPTNPSQDQTTPTTVVLPSSHYSPLPLNICMMCTNTNNGTAHEDPSITIRTDFSDIKALASRLIVGIHSDEIEKKLLSWKESRPQIFDDICLYSEVCYILTMSSVRVAAQRFLHDLFSDCQFQKLHTHRYEVDTVLEEDEEDEFDSSTNS